MRVLSRFISQQGVFSTPWRERFLDIPDKNLKGTKGLKTAGARY